MKKRSKREFGLTAMLLMGAAFAIAVLLGVSFILAVAANMMKDPTSLIGAFSLASLLITGIVSGSVTSRVRGDGGVLIGSLSSVIAGAVILIIGLVLTRGALSFGTVINVLAFIGVSVIASVIGKKKTGKKRRRYS